MPRRPIRCTSRISVVVLLVMSLLVFLGWLGVGEATRVAAAAVTTTSLRLVELARNARSTTA